MALRLGLAARGGGRPRGQSRPGESGSRAAGWGEGAPPRADLGVGIAVAAAGSTAGPAGPQGRRWGGRRRRRRRGRVSPAPPLLRRVTFRRQRGRAREARAPGRTLGSPGPREAGVPREEALGRKARGRGRKGGDPHPRPGPAATPARRAEGGGGISGAAFAFPPREQPGVSGPGRSGRSSHADGEISRCGASERRADLYRRGTCPSASGTAQYGERSFATARRAGSRRARLGDLARRWRRRRRRPRCPWQRLLA